MATVNFLEVVLQEKNGRVQKVYLVLWVDCPLVCVDELEELFVGLGNSEVLLIHGHAEWNCSEGSFWH